VDLEEERPPPPGSDFAQRVAYVIYAVSALFTIALPVFLIVCFAYAMSQMS
jgi:hypothetical protein